MDKKNATLQKKSSVNERRNYTITPRQCRALTALYRQPCTVANLRQVVGCNNVPDMIAGLRRYGLLIPCEWVRHTDRDGRKGKHGVYHLSHTDRLKVSALVGGGHE